MSKKILLTALVLSFMYFSLTSYVSAGTPELESKYAVLIDSESGNVLFEKDADTKTPIASITKIMTMLIAMDKLSKEEIALSDIIEVSERAANMGGSQLYLETGEKRTVEELLFGIAIESGNDAAVALAEGLGGSYDAFINIMNDKAAELGMKNTYFSTPCGLDDENNYSTAKDVAIMSKELLNYDQIYDFINVWTVDITIGKNNDIERTLTNTNKMLTRYDDIDGIKTGYTSASGHCISVTSQKDNMRLIGVILSAPDSKTRFEEAAKIIDHGFTNFTGKYIAKAGENVGNFNVGNSRNDSDSFTVKEDIYLNMKKEEKVDITKDISFDKTAFNAPISKDERIGVARFFVNGEFYDEAEIYPYEDIEKCSFRQYVNNVKSIVLP